MPIKPIPDEHISQTASGITAALFKVIDAVNQLVEKENAREQASKSAAVRSKRKAKTVPNAKASGQDKKVEE